MWGTHLHSRHSNHDSSTDAIRKCLTCNTIDIFLNPRKQINWDSLLMVQLWRAPVQFADSERTNHHSPSSYEGCWHISQFFGYDLEDNCGGTRQQFKNLLVMLVGLKSLQHVSNIHKQALTKTLPVPAGWQWFVQCLSVNCNLRVAAARSHQQLKVAIHFFFFFLSNRKYFLCAGNTHPRFLTFCCDVNCDVNCLVNIMSCPSSTRVVCFYPSITLYYPRTHWPRKSSMTSSQYHIHILHHYQRKAFHVNSLSLRNLHMIIYIFE